MRVVRFLLLAMALACAGPASEARTRSRAVDAPVQMAQGAPAPADATPSAPAASQPPASASGAAPVPATPPAAAAAPPPPPPQLDVEPVLKQLVARMDNAEKAVAAIKDRDEELGRLRGDVEGVMYESTQIAEALRPRHGEVKGQIDKLGPPPKADGPAEAPPVAAERARLNALLSAIDGAIKTSELTWVRARQLIERITDLRHALFAQSIFQQLPSPFSLALWRSVWNDAGSVYNTLAYVTHSWIDLAAPKSATVLATFIVSGVLYLALGQTFRMASAGRRRQRATPPSFFERAAAVTWFAPLKAIAPIFAILLLYLGLEALDVLHFWADRVLWAIVRAVLIFSAIAALVVSVLAPGEPSWRLVPLSERSTRQISFTLQAIAGVFAADLALAEISRTLTLHVTFNVVETIAANLVLASLMMCVLLTPFSAHDGDEHRVARTYPLLLKGPVFAVVLCIIAATFAGYVALGRFMAHQLILTGVVVVVSGLLYLAIRAFTREPQPAGLPVGEMLETTFGLDEQRRRTLARLTEFTLTLLLLMLAVPFILLQWGFSGADIRDWFRSIFFGFEIGHFRISLAKILLGILLFIGLVLATRLVQRWIREVMLTPARLEAGLSHSIDTVLGYVGTTIAALLALSYAGFDITNLAIVAGALSVGIGFGLQSIVNNFVSGLILLFERPIKVGDWIVVGGDEGIVRKISVRSTELETFDRSSVVVPNAELISGRVRNWTLRDTVGRARITFSVRYDMDPAKARDVVLDLANKHPAVLKQPAAFVSFDTFTGDSATLSLNIYVSDVMRAGRVRSELSFAILTALPSAGIALMPGAVPAVGAAPAASSTPIRISIAVASDADLQRARQVLAETAGRQAGIVADPAPQVEFEAASGEAVTFAIAAMSREGANPATVRTDLALAVLTALRAAGIASPSPSHSVKLTDLEPLRQGLMQALEERRRKEVG